MTADPLHGLTEKQKFAASLRLCDGLPLSVIGERMEDEAKKSAVSRLVRRALQRIESNGWRWDWSERRFVPIGATSHQAA